MKMSTICLLLLMQGSVSHAEQRSAAAAVEGLRFEVVSVREAKDRGLTSSLQWSPRRLVTRNYPLLSMVIYAYEIATPHHLVWDADELQSARFDVEGTLPDGVGSLAMEDRRRLLRSLLVERFRLESHVETREVPIYALQVDRGGVLGPNLRASEHNCDRWQASRFTGIDFVDPSSPPSRTGEPTDEGGRSWCMSAPEFLQDGGLRLRYAGPIGSLIRSVRSSADRPIVDETGLDGSFEWTLTYAPPVLADFFGGSSFPGVFAAMREQLGLTLEPRMAPMEVRVIDSVSMPEPN